MHGFIGREARRLLQERHRRDYRAYNPRMSKPLRLLLLLSTLLVLASPASAQVTAIRAGRLIDPESGTAAANQVILVENGRFTAVGANVAIPAGAEVIDLSTLTVLPGLVDAHNHLALTYKDEPESNVYYFTYVTDSTALRAIQAASNGLQMLSSGFTIVRDMGNNGNYADTALRVAIEQGWLPGPTIINSGLIIGGMGGQFFPTPEMAIDKRIVYPEYLDADTPDEIVKAVRQNVLFGAKVIKICVDCKPYGYTADEIRLVIAEAAKSGMKVEGHCQTEAGARRAIEAGIWSIAHDSGMTDALHKLMAQKGIWRAGTETPISLTGHTSQERYDRTVKLLGKHGAADLLHRRRLLRAAEDARRGGDRVHRNVESGRHSERRHPARDDDQRVQGERNREDARPDQGRHGGRPDCRHGQPARRHRGAAVGAVRVEGRPGVQTGRRDDAREVPARRPGQGLAHPMNGKRIVAAASCRRSRATGTAAR
jgi:imidazolonepropionase-like amidohydrolase